MKSFDELTLSAPLQRAIADLGYTTPSPIQAQALPLLLGEPTDFLGLAATGTGKTAAFAIPLLEKIDPKKKGVQALILCPTRELALQVAGQIDLLGKHKHIRALPVYGGSGYADQIRGMKQGAQIVVGTPGRVIDHLERGTLNLERMETIVLDEADEMISMGFREAIEAILQSAPLGETSNIWLFSATMSPEVRKVADVYLRNPKQVQVNRSEMLPGTVEQIYYMTRETNKPEVLCKIIDAAQDFYGLIFCQTKSLVTDLTAYLTERGYRVDCLHGDKSQDARERTMNAFRERKTKMLICTDVAARGLDVKDITHVINYSIPREIDSYVHRIGRTGRSGKTGIAISLVTPSHRGLVSRIAHVTGTPLKEGQIPTRKEIGIKKIAAFFERFQDQKQFDRAVQLMDDSWKELIALMTPEEIAGRFLSLIVPDVFMKDERPPMPKPKEVYRQEAYGRRPAYGANRGNFDRRSDDRRSDGGPRGRKFDGPTTGRGPSKNFGKPYPEKATPRFEFDSPEGGRGATKSGAMRPDATKTGATKPGATKFSGTKSDAPKRSFERGDGPKKQGGFSKPTRSLKSQHFDKADGLSQAPAQKRAGDKRKVNPIKKSSKPGKRKKSDWAELEF